LRAGIETWQTVCLRGREAVLRLVGDWVVRASTGQAVPGMFIAVFVMLVVVRIAFG
jgi:hypothetical protein